MRDMSSYPEPAGWDAIAAIPCTIMRGGTSRAIFVWSEHLPSSPEDRDSVILDMFGSPDARQIDGLGGADPLTSKLAIIDSEAPPGNHLTYTFGQVGIAEDHVDYLSLCGNITSAVGLFGVLHGLCDTDGDRAEVNVWNTNFGAQLRVSLRVRDGRPETEGHFVVAGVPGTGSPIVIDFADTAGRSCGSLFPSGNVRDTVACDFGEIPVTMIDVGNPHVFVAAASVGLSGFETSDELAGQPLLLQRLESIREAAALRMGMLQEGQSAATVTPAVPILVVVTQPDTYVPEGGVSKVSADSYHVRGRVHFMQRPHKAYAGTSTVATGVAARTPGTVVAACSSDIAGDEVIIGHPQGRIRTFSDVRSAPSGDHRVIRATVTRTARRILEGTVYLKTPPRSTSV